MNYFYNYFYFPVIIMIIYYSFTTAVPAFNLRVNFIFCLNFQAFIIVYKSCDCS